MLIELRKEIARTETTGHALEAYILCELLDQERKDREAAAYSNYEVLAEINARISYIAVGVLDCEDEDGEEYTKEQMLGYIEDLLDAATVDIKTLLDRLKRLCDASRLSVTA